MAYVEGIAQTSDSFSLKESGLSLDFDLFQHRCLRLRTVLPETYKSAEKLPDMNEESDNEVFLHITGENRASHHGSKLTGSNPGMRLQYVEKKKSQPQPENSLFLYRKIPLRILRWNRIMNFTIKFLL